MKQLLIYLCFFILVFSEGASARQRSFKLNAALRPSDYEEGKIILKLKPEYRDACQRNSISLASLNEKFSLIRAGRIEKKFPNHKPPAAERNANGLMLTDLSLIYELAYDPAIPLEKAVNILLSDESVDYAEPVYTVMPLYVPNDTSLALCYQLVNIHAYDGWDINKGDSSIVIGITDTGTDLDHPDLVNSVKYNYSDPINGIDDDGDGYVDNFMGWDLGDNDNDPSVSLVHGSFVAGCSSATADNITGIAGSGFNCKYLPVKIASGNILNKAYEGIVYAADHGCQIINCSWGGFGGGQFGQDIVNYATINMNRLVIGAAGNNNDDAVFYPASYKYVFSVAATNINDEKWTVSAGGSSYGSNIDVCAPGQSVYSTIWDNNYTASSGTSFSAPIVAGVTGIVMAHFPSLSPLQAAEQVRATCDDIYSLPGNAPYINLLGKGRINLFRALTETNARSVRMTDLEIKDGNDEAFAANDTLSIRGVITNWLNPVTGLTLTLTCNSPDITILDGTFSAGNMASLASINNNADPFRIRIEPSVPLNSKVLFTINFTDASGYSDFQCFDLTLNVDYINVLINDVGTSITSRGRIGYNAPNQSQGIGFTFNDGETLLFEGCLLAGDSPSRVSDQMFGSPVTVNDTDFTAVEYVRELIPSSVSDFDLYSSFNDDGAGINKLDIGIAQRTFAWSTPDDARYIMIYYTFRNKGTSALNNFYAGIYADWDLGAVINNRAAVNNGLKLGYAWEDAANGLYAGVKVLGNAPFNIYAVDNNGINGSFSIYDGFTKAEKYTAMSTQRTDAGTSGSGNDVSVMVASGPYTIQAGDSVKVGFALLASDSLSTLLNAAAAADIKFNSISSVQQPNPLPVSISRPFPNPFTQSADFSVNLSSTTQLTVELLDITGMKIKSLVNGKYSAGNYSFRLDGKKIASGIYLLKLRLDEKETVFKIVKVDD